MESAHPWQDVSQPWGRILFSSLDGRNDVLVNHAGIDEYGEFVTLDSAHLDRMLRLNMLALAELTHAVLPEMVARQSGAILNFASTAAFQSTFYPALYGATKAFVRNLSSALWRELRGKDVLVTCVGPGPAELFDCGGYEARRDDFMRFAADADRVAERAIDALTARKVIVTPGLLNKLGAFLTRFGSVTVATRAAARILGPRPWRPLRSAPFWLVQTVS